MNNFTYDWGMMVLVLSSLTATWCLGAWLVCYPGGWLVARMMRSKREVLDQALKQQAGAGESGEAWRPAIERGFDDGGAAIGRLERFLIYLLVLNDSLSGVGFLIAAKSIFRFGELSDHKNRLEAEYITIGTLMSFGVGVAGTMVARLGIQAVLGALGIYQAPW